MGAEDWVAKPIFPRNLNRILGIQFTSASQLAERVGITIEQSRTALKYLLSVGYVEPWIAPKCNNCDYIWPLCKEDEEDQIPKEDCPICNHPITAKTVFYTIYKMLKEPHPRSKGSPS